ncbi:MAG TPA: hypothetical protein VIV12_03975 [Streptosporangiaceae bacterium]
MTTRSPGEDGQPSLLVLGGTRFVGPAFADAAVEPGWRVTTFSRGQTGVAAEGDRTVEADLRVVAGQPWDVVVDAWSGPPTCGSGVRLDAGQPLRAYIYVSAESVYADPGIEVTEDAPLVAASAPDDASRYAANKRAAEVRPSTTWAPTGC